MERLCADCDRYLTRTSYTTNQWSKGAGISRCANCVHGHHSDQRNESASGSGRHNLSSSTTLDYGELENPFAEGAFRWVAKGTYTSGPRSGQPAVHKWFKSGSVFSEDFFALDIKAVDKALEFIDKFNELGVVGKVIKLNIPTVCSLQTDLVKTKESLSSHSSETTKSLTATVAGQTTTMAGPRSCRRSAISATT